jgi:two-component sensor histidine kinase
MRRFLYESTGRFKAFLFGAALLIIALLLFYTEQLVDGLRQESRSILQFYAGMYARAASDTTSSDVSFIFDEIIKRTYFPIIYTDADRRPLWWKGIGVPEMDRSEEALQKVEKIKRRMSKISEPIPIKYQDITLGYLYYGDSSTITRLRWLPYIEIGLISLFILVGFIGFSTIKKSEQRFIWVGMAKETAHQLGTPLSSLMGWLELLKDRSYNRPSTLKILDEMYVDIHRLRKVAERFSQIGSQADLREQSIHPILDNVVAYIQRRLPHMKKVIRIEKQYGDIPPVPVNADLLEWVFENLVKNAVDAIDHQEGVIRIRTGRSDRRRYRIFVDVQDNGRGIIFRNKNDVFRPGFSTKKRGWGLGLNLSKRIVEEYHRGKLIVKESHIGQGTTMRVYL